MGSAMAHAARDPWFRAAVVIAERDHPGIGDLCFRCHAPEAWLEGRCSPSDGSRLLPTDQGVGCAGCHRMLPNPFVQNGQYVVLDETRMIGPYSETPSPHATAQSDWVSDSRFCGTCHDLMNPLVARRSLDGTVSDDPFPEQTTYSEWAQSAFAANGATCQSCHMPEVPGRNAMEGPVREARSIHGFAGGNLFLLDSVGLLFPELGIQAQLLEGERRIRQMLSRAARVDGFELPASVMRGETVRLRVRVTNESGHKLPTGYPEGRRVFLAGRSTALGFDRGSYDAATNTIAEPFAVYEAVHGSLSSGPSHHLATNDVVLSDSRLPPRGFFPTATTAPVGKTFALLASGALAHYDDITITATIPCELEADVDLSFELFYQSIHAGAVDPVVTEIATTPEGQAFALSFATFDSAPISIATFSTRIPLARGSCGEGADSGVAAGRVPTYAGVTDAGQAHDDDGGGCGCSSAAAHEASTTLALLAFGVIVFFRRAFHIGR